MRPKTTKASGQADFCDDATVLLTGHESHDLRETFRMNTAAGNKKAQVGNNIADELLESFQRIAQPVNGAAVRTYDFLHGMANLFTDGRARVAVCHYGGACSDSGHIEVAGRAPKTALEGLRRVRGREAPAALCWRQGHSGDAPLYALDGLGQLADLLAAAGEVRQ